VTDGRAGPFGPRGTRALLVGGGLHLGATLPHIPWRERVEETPPHPPRPRRPRGEAVRSRLAGSCAPRRNDSELLGVASRDRSGRDGSGLGNGSGPGVLPATILVVRIKRTTDGPSRNARADPFPRPDPFRPDLSPGSDASNSESLRPGAHEPLGGNGPPRRAGGVGGAGGGGLSDPFPQGICGKEIAPRWSPAAHEQRTRARGPKGPRPARPVPPARAAGRTGKRLAITLRYDARRFKKLLRSTSPTRRAGKNLAPEEGPHRRPVHEEVLECFQA